MKKGYSVLLMFALPLTFIAQISERGQGQGPFSGTAATNTNCSFAFGSSVGYTPAANVLASDNVYATVTHAGNADQNTQCLVVTGFGFNIPTTAIISGIALQVEKKRDAGGSGIVVDNGIQLMKQGVLVGQNKKDVTTDWPTTDTYVLYGSGSDLWNTSWTPAEINSNIGVAIASISYSSATIKTYIDDVTLTVSYTSGGTGITQTASSNGKIALSPNPVVSGDKIQFSTIKKIDEITIFDVTGKQVLKGNSDNNEMVLPVLNAGLYIYKINNEEFSTTGKIIIK